MWNWFASGKHPAVKDYMTVGAIRPWSEAFAKTAGLAYRSMVVRNAGHVGPAPCFFWAAGPERDVLACGYMGDSRDGLGRPYPLIMLGTGHVRDWGGVWDMLPLLFSATWKAMARVAHSVYDTLAGFQQALEAVPSPAEVSPAVMEAHRLMIREARRRFFFQGHGLPDPDRVRFGNRHFAMTIPRGFSDCGPCYWHHVIKQRAGTSPPTAAFISGQSNASMHLFFRPVRPKDLTGLWLGT